MSENQSTQPTQQVTITPKQAFQLLADVAAQFRGTRADHITLEQALKVIQDVLPKE